MGKLQNKTAVITGAASGMGRAMAQLFAREGARIILADVSQKELDELVANIRADGGQAVAVVADVSKESDVKRMIDVALQNFQSLDVLVNNAGIMDDFLPVDKLSNAQWEHVMGVNLNGPFFACRLAVPQMLKQGTGVIINISSIGGLQGSRAGAAYTASKHALIGLTKNIGFMYASSGIRCNAIAPGGVNTNIVKGMQPDAFGQQRCSSGGVNMPRMGEPEEIARTGLFLACDDSSFVNGAVLTADGGWTAY